MVATRRIAIGERIGVAGVSSLSFFSFILSCFFFLWRYGDLASAKTEGSCKKRKCEDGAACSSSQATEVKRPPGVKAAKASGKKTVTEENATMEFHSMVSLKERDIAMKDRMSKMRLLESLINKQHPLLAYEEGLKKKLVDELMLS